MCQINMDDFVRSSILSIKQGLIKTCLGYNCLFHYNFAKSHFKVSLNTPLRIIPYKEIFRMSNLNKFDHHLGAPIDLIGTKKENFQFLIDRISQKISAWNAIPLLQPQKLILINSILIAAASHIMNCFELPVTITKKIDSLIAGFF